MVNLLLVHSADPNSTGAQGNTSLMNAVSHGYPLIAKNFWKAERKLMLSTRADKRQ
ncbi:MAG: hypothetical protein Ct9H90mP8_0250 [Pseudomonadota bacterium]|nr:MAG: hypothetical protein Ct9H90mP8_0250 [Pseudomonadota bacterium]